MDVDISFDFKVPKSKNELCKFIGIPTELFDWCVDPDNRAVCSAQHNRTVEQLVLSRPPYFQHMIPKRSRNMDGEFRVVWEPSSELSDHYKTFARRFDLFLREFVKGYPHPASYGYVRGRSTLDNAKKHAGAKFLVSADIRNFFPSISKDRLCQKFIAVGLNETVADCLADFVTIDHSLALGFHSSPMLANFICLELDAVLSEFERKYNCVYTRYADDLSFSGNGTLPSKEEISKCLTDSAFELSERKFRFSKIGQSHFVTGLSISDPKAPHVPKKMKRWMRQTMYFCKKYGIHNHIYKTEGHLSGTFLAINRIDGYVRYISHIETDSFPTLREDWNALMKRDGIHPSYESHREFEEREAKIYVDESVFDYRERTYLALAFVPTYDFTLLRAEAVNTHRQHMSDPFADGDMERLLKKGLHFVDASEDLRKAYIDKLQSLPVNAYIAFCELPPDADYQERYLHLVSRLLPHRLKHFDQVSLELIFEENDAISTEKLFNLTQGIYQGLVKSKDRSPFEFTSRIGSKKDFPEFSAPDFFLCVWGRYAKMEPKNQKLPQRHQVLFERLRDKTKVIINCDNNLVFSRKRPFRSFHELEGNDLH